jgi:hypothetical protein
MRAHLEPALWHSPTSSRADFVCGYVKLHGFRQLSQNGKIRAYFCLGGKKTLIFAAPGPLPGALRSLEPEYASERASV